MSGESAHNSPTDVRVMLLFCTVGKQSAQLVQWAAERTLDRFHNQSPPFQSGREARTLALLGTACSKMARTLLKHLHIWRSCCAVYAEVKARGTVRKEIRLRCSTINQEQPCGLQVTNCRNAFEQTTVCIRLLPKEMADEVGVPQRCPRTRVPRCSGGKVASPRHTTASSSTSRGALWSASQPGGSRPPLFHTLVFPRWWMEMFTCLSSSSPDALWASLMRCGSFTRGVQVVKVSKEVFSCFESFIGCH